MFSRRNKKNIYLETYVLPGAMLAGANVLMFNNKYRQTPVKQAPEGMVVQEQMLA